MNIGIVGGDGSYAKPFSSHAKGMFDVSRADQIEYYSIDVLVFTGGVDVDPWLYGEEPHPTTFYSPARDDREVAIYQAALRRGVRMCGICRGSQFLTVMNGGLLVQHIDNHGIPGTHQVRDMSGIVGGDVGVTSTHHQMMYPFNLASDTYQILAGCSITDKVQGMPDGYDDLPLDVEAVWYPNTKCLCVQFHPEYMPKDSDGYKYYQALLSAFIFNQ